jgi:hypothetical protein
MVLLISGAGAAFANSPRHTGTIVKSVPAAAPAAAAPEVTTPDGDNVQEGDQTTPDTGTEATTESTTPDTDTLQEGDQTTPDAPAANAPASVAKAAAPAAVTVKAVSKAKPAVAKVKTVKAHKAATTAAEPAGEPSGEGTGTETTNDGPGGHADDPNDPNADHQFQGEE